MYTEAIHQSLSNSSCIRKKDETRNLSTLKKNKYMAICIEKKIISNDENVRTF